MTAEPKSIHDEMGATFDEYGRMKASLGRREPGPHAGPGELHHAGLCRPRDRGDQALEHRHADRRPGGDGTQIWQITHNGVDTHPIHFHLFHVQLINRVGWDGAFRLPDANELGWKDTVRISPLEDTYVALRPIAPLANILPFKIPNSFRPLEPALPLGSTMAFSNVDPLGNPITPASRTRSTTSGGSTCGTATSSATRRTT